MTRWPSCRLQAGGFGVEDDLAHRASCQRGAFYTDSPYGCQAGVLLNRPTFTRIPVPRRSARVQGTGRPSSGTQSSSIWSVPSKPVPSTSKRQPPSWYGSGGLTDLVGLLAGELLAGVEEQLEAVLEDRAHVILFVEDHVVREADAEQITLADVEVGAQDQIALPLEIDVEVTFPDQAPVVGPGERGIAIAQIFGVERAVAVLGLLALVEQLEIDPARLDRYAEEELALADPVEAALDLPLDQAQPRPDVAVEEPGRDLVGLP